jgi:hypothetical protein
MLLLEAPTLILDALAKKEKKKKKDTYYKFK